MYVLILKKLNRSLKLTRSNRMNMWGVTLNLGLFVTVAAMNITTLALINRGMIFYWPLEIATLCSELLVKFALIYCIFKISFNQNIYSASLKDGQVTVLAKDPKGGEQFYFVLDDKIEKQPNKEDRADQSSNSNNLNEDDSDQLSNYENLIRPDSIVSSEA